MRFVLYNHVGSGNHGCEALVRTISHMLGESLVLLLSDSFEEEQKYAVTELIQVKDSILGYKKVGLDFGYAYWQLKVNKNYFFMDILKYKSEIKKLKFTDVLVSIGGDIFCYDDYLKYILIHKYAMKYVKHSILLGCSIEPELLKDKSLVNDLNTFEIISARERITYDALKNAHIKNVLYCPDTAFCLPVEKTELPNNFKVFNTVGINISPLVLNKAADSKLILDNFRVVVAYILKNTEFSVAFIPHVVWRDNDDRVPLKILYEEFKESNRVCMVEDQNAQRLKWIISKCSYFIGARTHATIAAYSTGVPTLVLGYSVKSRGIARDLFGTEENYVLSYQKVKSSNTLLEKFCWIIQHDIEIRSILKTKIPEYQQMIEMFGRKIKKKYEENKEIDS